MGCDQGIQNKDLGHLLGVFGIKKTVLENEGNASGCI